MNSKEALTKLVNATREMKLPFETHANIDMCANIIVAHLNRGNEKALQTESPVIGLEQE